DLDDVPAVALAINDLPMMPSTEWAIKSGEWPNMIEAYLACISFADAQVGTLLDALDASPYADNTVTVLWSDHRYRVREKGTIAKHAPREEATHAQLLSAGAGIPSAQNISESVKLLSSYPTLLELTQLPAYHRNEGKSLVPLLQGAPAR